MRYASSASMNKTIYLRDEEVPVWERARELAGDKLSPVIVTALRRFVAEKEAEAKGFERIELRFNDADANNMPKIKAFYGRWIFDLNEPLVLQLESGNYTHSYSIAETARGSVAIYTFREDLEDDSTADHKLLTFSSFEDAASNRVVNAAVCLALVKRGIPIEELDI